ncbi:hypothetical protein [Tsukamurella paurometabola]|uniref:Uncharacterized protein n=1 Tax=Tsukamurella paurometabola TaxID=2061 RepID=A0A3P8MBN1_TSUPA|nr:hypothetical protein [Tsukamurella paurometabola]UEA81172.1 hypothetical protein LK411_12155 [Tsukamurella paurometabola]VDR38146.1 Uncharacterised protein [Tsukamurella paurometabola]
MGFDSQKDRLAAWGLLAIPVYIAVASIYVLIHVTVFFVCAFVIDGVLSTVFDGAAITSSGWWTAGVVALAIAASIGIVRTYDRIVLGIRRKRGKAQADSITLRKAAGEVVFTAVDWAELVRNLAVLVPALAAALLIVKNTAVPWFAPSPFVTKLLVVFVGVLIAYPLFKVEERVLGAAKRRRLRRL